MPRTSPVYSEEELLDSLQAAAQTLGEAPTKEWYDEHGEFGTTTIASRFGSWNEAIRAAGLDVIKRGRIPKKELIGLLRDAAEELGEPPTVKWMEERGSVAASTFVYRFGSWNEALEGAGLDFNQYRTWPEDELVSILQNHAEELGHSPTYKWMEEYGDAPSRVYHRSFGSWNEALEAAGLEPNQEYCVSDETLLNTLERTASELGRTPTVTWMNENGVYTGETYKRRFGTWNEALRRTGLDPNQEVGTCVWTECAECGADIHRPQSRVERATNLFCDMDCYAAFRSVEHPKHRFGDNWLEQREAAIGRDGACVLCGIDRDEHIETHGKDLHVHHIVPRAEFIENGHYDAEAANSLDNLMAVCVRCHPTLDEPLKAARP